jgi:hypothetical protein
MAYGCQASLDHAKLKLERALEALMQQSAPANTPTDVRAPLTDLIVAAGYLLDALKYLKAGMP